MNIGYFVILGLWVFTFILLILKGKIIEQNLKEILTEKIDKEIREKHAQRIRASQDLEEMQERQRDEIQRTEVEIENRKIVLQALDQSIENSRQYVDRYIEDVKQEKLKTLDEQIKNEGIEMTRRAQAEHQRQLDTLELIRKNIQKEIDQISINLEAFRAKQDAINQELLRQREMEEQNNFYRVCLTDDAIADINLLQVTRQNLKKPEIIDKIIYDTYIAKPVLEMIKRVLQNSTCSGIYKITCQETKEVYIGKSTDVKNRWQQHCKTAFNCGTIASSVLHRKMQQYGIENFTFELLESVPKDQLSEREKFYINFYRSKEVGLNERNG